MYASTLHALSALDAQDIPRLIERQPTPHGTVYVSGTFAMPSRAFAAKERYLRDWPPAGYGTLMTVRHDEQNDRWIVEGSRAASCD